MKRALLLALALLIAVPSSVLGHWPVKGKVSQWYSRSHRAIDIAAPRGTFIRPIAAGVVLFAGWKRNCGGWQVWIRHERFSSAYYHLSRRPLVEKGQRVGTATRIGVVGSTGCSTGPHVHVETWTGLPWRSTRVNPLLYIRSTSDERTSSLRSPKPAPILHWRTAYWLRV